MRLYTVFTNKLSRNAVYVRLQWVIRYVRAVAVLLCFWMVFAFGNDVGYHGFGQFARDASAGYKAFSTVAGAV